MNLIKSEFLYFKYVIPSQRNHSDLNQTIKARYRQKLCTIMHCISKECHRGNIIEYHFKNS